MRLLVPFTMLFKCRFVNALLFVLFFCRCENEYLTAFGYLSAVMSSPVPKLKSIVQTFLDKELMRASKARLANKSGMHIHTELAVRHGIKRRQNVHLTYSGGEDREKLNGSVNHTLVGQQKFVKKSMMHRVFNQILHNRWNILG